MVRCMASGRVTMPTPTVFILLVNWNGKADTLECLFTPVIHYYDHAEDAWFAGARMDLSIGMAEHDNRRIPDRTEGPIEIPWTTGCAMFFRAEPLQKLGGLDERFFAYWEDVDLSLRLR